MVIEALWVTPDKMRELMAMSEHANRLWLVRIHSKPAFLAQEGVAIQWIKDYPEDVIVCPNTRGCTKDLRTMGVDAMYLPNIYEPHNKGEQAYYKIRQDDVLNIACFGALRPLKNHLTQALGAMRFAETLGKQMRFHINGTALGTVETNSVYNNLVSLFDDSPYELVVHDWVSHEAFVELVRTMDMGMQISLSESFNIVAADFVDNNIPMLASNEIDWLPQEVKILATADSDLIAQIMMQVWVHYHPGLNRKCTTALARYNDQSRDAWWRIVRKLA